MPYDLVIVAVKYKDLEDVVEEMKPAVGPDTVIISVMNGISSEDILAQTYLRRNVIDCVAISTASRSEWMRCGRRRRCGTQSRGGCKSA